MSEAAPEQTQEQAQAAAPPADTSAANSSDSPDYPVKLVKIYTGDVHWNVAQGIWELVKHGETGEPNSVYQLVATIDGVDVPLTEFNSGGIELLVKSAQAAAQSSGS